MNTWWYQVLNRAWNEKNQVIITMKSGTQFHASKIISPGRLAEPGQPVIVEYKITSSAYTDYPPQTHHIDSQEIAAITVWKPL